MNRIVASWGPVIVHRLVLGGGGERRIWLCPDQIVGGGGGGGGARGEFGCVTIKFTPPPH